MVLSLAISGNIYAVLADRTTYGIVKVTGLNNIVRVAVGSFDAFALAIDREGVAWSFGQGMIGCGETCDDMFKQAETVASQPKGTIEEWAVNPVRVQFPGVIKKGKEVPTRVVGVAAGNKSKLTILYYFDRFLPQLLLPGQKVDDYLCGARTI